MEYFTCPSQNPPYIWIQFAKKTIFDAKFGQSRNANQEVREEAVMPLRKLAALPDIDQSTLSKIERNLRRANAQMIEQVARILTTNKEILLTAIL